MVPRNFLAGGILAVLVIAADQLVKAWLKVVLLNPTHIVPITGFFSLVPAENRGIGFSLFGTNSGWGSWVFSGLALVVSVIMLRWLWSVARLWLVLALGLIIGGALGNMIDRLRFGAVFDFLYFHAGAYSFPAFNLADSAISVGVGLMLLDSLFSKRETAK